jgi:hypothetical protein
LLAREQRLRASSARGRGQQIDDRRRRLRAHDGSTARLRRRRRRRPRPTRRTRSLRSGRLPARALRDRAAARSRAHLASCHHESLDMALQLGRTPIVVRVFPYDQRPGA